MTAHLDPRSELVRLSLPRRYRAVQGQRAYGPEPTGPSKQPRRSGRGASRLRRVAAPYIGRGADGSLAETKETHVAAAVRLWSDAPNGSQDGGITGSAASRGGRRGDPTATAIPAQPRNRDPARSRAREIAAALRGNAP